MGAFSPMWKDIDDTKPGAPYIVDSDGWGWFFLFILLSIPFLAVGSVLVWARDIVCEHPLISAIVYFLICGIFGMAFYWNRSIKHRICGLLGSMLTLLPLGTAVAFYVIPYLQTGNLLSVTFDFILIAAIIVIITYFIFSICNLLRNGLIHLIVGTIFFSIVFLMVMGNLSSSEDMNWEVIKQLYGF